MTDPRNKLTAEERECLGPPRVIPPRQPVQVRAAQQSLLGGLHGSAHWTDRAACRGRAALFDEQGDDESSTDANNRHRAARVICAACPVWLLCGLDAYDQGGAGVRAGIVYSYRDDG